MSGLIGKKIGMTSVFSVEGKNIPCTVIEAGPCVVTQIKTVEKDGYSAVQIAYDEKKEKHTSNSLLGHFKKAGTTPKRKLAEFKSFERELNLGDVITVDTHNCIVCGNKKLIAAVGLEDLVVVDTDDALLICTKDHTQDVKKVIENLKICNRDNLI